MKTNTMKRLMILAAATAALGLPATASAGDLVGEVRLVSSQVNDDSVDAMTDADQILEAQIGFGWGLEEVLPGLRGYFSYGAGSLSETRLGGVATWDWTRHLFMAEGEWGPTLWTFFRPRARLGVGYAMQSLDFETSGSPLIYDYTHDLAVRPSAGFDIFLPLEWSQRSMPFTVGISTDFGYLWMTKSTFDEMRYEDDAFVPEDETDPYRREVAEMGELNTNGFFWNLGLQARIRF